MNGWYTRYRWKQAFRYTLIDALCWAVETIIYAGVLALLAAPFGLAVWWWLA